MVLSRRAAEEKQFFMQKGMKEGPLFLKKQRTVRLHISEDVCCFDIKVVGVRAQLMGLFIYQINPCVHFVLFRPSTDVGFC